MVSPELIALGMIAAAIIIILGVFIHFNRIKDKETKRTGKYPKGHYMGLGMALGVSLGIPLGLAMDNIALGPGVGLVLGLALGIRARETQRL